MLNKKNRWLINTILILAVLAFVGFSAVPIFSAWFENRQTAATGSAYANGSGADGAGSESAQAELQAQVTGYKAVLEREPNNETALLGLLQAQLQLNDIEGAVEPLEALSELKPEETRYTVLLGQAKQQLGDQDGAAQVYRNILSTQPGNMDALRGLVSLLVDGARPESAIGLLQDTLKTANDVNQIQANSVDVTAVQLLLGEVYVELDRDNDAIAIYDEAIKNSASDFRPLLSKALLLQDQGELEEASGLFTSAEALAPPQYKDEINRLAVGPEIPEASNLDAATDTAVDEATTSEESEENSEDEATTDPSDNTEKTADDASDDDAAE
ncbi:MAG: tetratricopeptide repeat protein [Cyanobacteria bacterium P01_F01_bin.150]